MEMVTVAAVAAMGEKTGHRKSRNGLFFNRIKIARTPHDLEQQPTSDEQWRRSAGGFRRAQPVRGAAVQQSRDPGCGRRRLVSFATGFPRYEVGRERVRARPSCPSFPRRVLRALRPWAGLSGEWVEEECVHTGRAGHTLDCCLKVVSCPRTTTPSLLAAADNHSTPLTALRPRSLVPANLYLLQIWTARSRSLRTISG